MELFRALTLTSALLWNHPTLSVAQCLSGADACFPPLPCDQREKVSEHSDCSYYQQCVAPYEWYTIVDECTGQTFSNITCGCVTDGNCAPWECPPGTSAPPRLSAPCLIGEEECTSTFNVVPDAYYCSKYFRCNPDTVEWESETCPEGEFFDANQVFLPQPCRASITACDVIPFDQCFPYTGPPTTTVLTTLTTRTTHATTSRDPTTTVTTTRESKTTTPTPTTSTTSVSAKIPTVSTTDQAEPSIQSTKVDVTTAESTTTTTTTTEEEVSTPQSTTDLTRTFTKEQTKAKTVPTSETTAPELSTTTHPSSADACEPLDTCTDGDRVAHSRECSLFFECMGGVWEPRNCQTIDTARPYYNPGQATCQSPIWVDCDIRCNTDTIKLDKMTKNIIYISVSGVIVISIIIVIPIVVTVRKRDSYDYCDSDTSGIVLITSVGWSSQRDK